MLIPVFVYKNEGRFILNMRRSGVLHANYFFEESRNNLPPVAAKGRPNGRPGPGCFCWQTPANRY